MWVKTDYVPPRYEGKIIPGKWYPAEDSGRGLTTIRLETGAEGRIYPEHCALLDGKSWDVSEDEPESVMDPVPQETDGSKMGPEERAVRQDTREHLSGLKDSGERRLFDTGAQRDRGALKGRPDLRPVHALHILDCHMEAGALKYEDRNWEQGMPLSEYFNSAQRHADKFLAGYQDEDHLAAWLWNVACLIETKHRIEFGLLPKELDDMPYTFKDHEPTGW